MTIMSVSTRMIPSDIHLRGGKAVETGWLRTIRTAVPRNSVSPREWSDWGERHRRGAAMVAEARGPEHINGAGREPCDIDVRLKAEAVGAAEINGATELKG